jgi:hypothetical protein
MYVRFPESSCLGVVISDHHDRPLLRLLVDTSIAAQCGPHRPASHVKLRSHAAVYDPLTLP